MIVLFGCIGYIIQFNELSSVYPLLQDKQLNYVHVEQLKYLV